MRQFDRKRGKYRLDEDKHEWKRVENEEQARLEAEKADAVMLRQKSEADQKAAEERKKAAEAKSAKEATESTWQ